MLDKEEYKCETELINLTGFDYLPDLDDTENMICVKPEEHPYIAAGSDVKTTRELIHIPNDAEYVEILGHKLYGDFGSFEKFCDYLRKCEALEDRWKEFRKYITDYKEEKCQKMGDYAEYGRYCVALSIDDILKKMEEIEGKNS